jgi:hypothetical protein
MPGSSDAEFDTSKPSIARVYDALLGGKDNFAADREMAQQMIDNIPGARDAALMNRAALARAVRYLTSRVRASCTWTTIRSSSLTAGRCLHPTR